MTEAQKKMCKSNFNLRSLRISLKYRPEILKLILKMRQCIRKKALIITKLKHRLKEMENNSRSFDVENIARNINTEITDTNGLLSTEANITPEPKILSINENVIKRPEIENSSLETDNVVDKTDENVVQAMEVEDTPQTPESKQSIVSSEDVIHKSNTKESSLQVDHVTEKTDINIVSTMDAEESDQAPEVKHLSNIEHIITTPSTENRSMQTDNIIIKEDTPQMPAMLVDYTDQTSELKHSSNIITMPCVENRSMQTENVIIKQVADEMSSMSVEDNDQISGLKHSSNIEFIITKPNTENRSIQTDNITIKEDADQTSISKISVIEGDITKLHTEERSVQTDNITDKTDQSTSMEVEDTDQPAKSKHPLIKKPKTKNRSVQTANVTDTINNETVSETKELKDKVEDLGWSINEENETKSIADQVKEVAQDAIEQTGMVYVESAGMYYDYKTGYYYNSELGLYYHTDTDCYYTYTEDKKNFVFHSYPVRSAATAALQAHEKRKARKHKMDRKAEEDIDNLTKNLSQGGQEDAKEENKPKRKRSKKKADKKPENKDSSAKPENNVQVEVSSPKAEMKPQEEISSQNAEMIPPEKISSPNAEMKPQEEISSPNAELKLQEDISSSNPDMKVQEEVPSPNTEITSKQVSSPKAEDNIEIKPSEVAEIKTENTSDSLEVEKEAQEEKSKAEKSEELEDGECSDTCSEGSASDDEEADEDEDVKSNASTSTATDDESVARQLPPCMRIIVRETKLPKLRVGSLFIVTKDGGTVGREGEHHTILLRDSNVSRDHLDIRYDAAYNSYVAIDLGSKNGSVLNGKRMSESQMYSEPMMIMHGSILELGETKLLCHIHPGNDTCGHCEPGLVMETSDKDKKVAYTRTCSVRKQHELELARLKNKYGAKQMLAIEETAYNDRAQARRVTVGSSHPAEKTQASDIDKSIAPDNKGFKLLEKMGWNKGEGLGKDSQGDVEPVPLISNAGKTGLGATQTPQPIAFTRTSKIGPATLRLASRTKMLQPPAKAFQGIFDEDSE